jgi:hypothetical protein
MADAREGEMQKVERDQSPTWIIRLAMGLIGILLLVGAFIAWHMHLEVGGFYASLLPWAVVAAVLLGVGAVVESIKTSVWLMIFAGIFAVLTAYVITGRYVVNLDASSHAVFVVDRYTGETHYCDADQCHTLSEGVSITKVVKRIESIHH